MTNPKPSISVVTPTFRRSGEVAQLLDNLSSQTVLPDEVIIVDGAEESDTETEMTVLAAATPFTVRYIRHNGGTAIQRNVGIDNAKGDLIAMLDDDVRLETDFFEAILEAFDADAEKKIGGMVGYRTNVHFSAEDSARWRWYRRLRLLKTFEPGRYDAKSGYPINNNMQPPFEGTRPVDFMTSACTVWRREVFDSGLRFDPFFSDYGVLEDAHLALRAKRDWELVQNGSARCIELHSPNGRVSSRKVGYKCVVNYYFVFNDTNRPLTRSQKLRFWRFQAFEFLRIAASLIRRRRWSDAEELIGRIEGTLGVARGAASGS
jgi:glycosyltransferase involved in cell wall biosynthesis